MNNFEFYSRISTSPLFYLLLAVDLILKGMALYKSARKSQTVWFIVILLVNSFGILPLIYLLIQNSAENKVVPVVKTKKSSGKKK